MTSSSAQSRERAKGATSGHESPALDAGNVVLFSRAGRASAAPPIVLGADDRPAPWLPRDNSRGLLPVFFACAIALHAGLYALDREPAPVASIGEVSISVDILLGSQVAAGLAASQSPSAVASPGAPEEQSAKAAEPAEPTPVQAPAEPQTAMREPEPQPNIEQVPALPPPVPAENPSTRSIEPRPPVTRQPPSKAREPRGKSQREARREPAENARTSPSTASAASSGAGRGRSDADSNYRGLVFAHLARHQQYPADARARGEQGSASVTFSIDGSGRVTSVRLARGSGIASFDQESQAMVRRASPFPSPPAGRPMTFNAPVGFRLR